MASKKREEASVDADIEGKMDSHLLQPALSEDQLVPIREKLQQVIKSMEQLAEVHNRTTSLAAITGTIEAAQEYIAAAERLSKEIPETHVLMGVDGSIGLNELRRKCGTIFREVREGRRYVLHRKKFPLAYLRKKTGVEAEEIDRNEFARIPGEYLSRVFEERCTFVMPNEAIEIAPLPPEFVEESISPEAIRLRERIRVRQIYRKKLKEWDEKWNKK